MNFRQLAPLCFVLAVWNLVGCGSGGAKDWSDHTQGLPFIVGYEEGMKAAAEQQKPAMVFVTATWCGWCKKLAEENFNDPEERELLGKFVCIIVDGDVESAAAAKLGADGYPHIVFLTSGGEKLGEHSGYAPVAEFKPMLHEALAKSRGEK